MKHTLLLFAVIIISFFSCTTSRYAQTSYPNPFEFQKIDTIPGTKDELFVKANEWVAKTFVDAKSVIQMHDKEAGKIIAKGIIKSSSSQGAMIGSTTCYVSYTLQISVKEGKYKVSLSDYYLSEQIIHPASGPERNYTMNNSFSSDGNPSGIYPKVWENAKGDAYSQSKDLLMSLSKYMHSKSQEF